MASALSSSKRKFYRLLEGLSASPSTTSFEQTEKQQDDDDKSEARNTKRARIGSDKNLSSDRTRPRASTSASAHGSLGSRLGIFKSSMLQPTPSVRLVTTADRRRQLGLGSSTSNAEEASDWPYNTTNGAAQDTRPLPNYAPWSDQQFLIRLKTYADIKIWPPKPEVLDEVQWAKRGWICDGVNTVVCKGCNAKLVIELHKPGRRRNLDQEWAAEFDDAMIQKYSELIIEGHDGTCLWKSAGCKDDIHRIRMGDVAARNAGIKARYESLLQIAQSLPDTLAFPHTFHRIHPVEVPDEPLDPQYLIDSAVAVLFPHPRDAQAAAGLQSSPKESAAQEINKTALALAIFGWSGVMSYGIPMSTCSHCFVRNGMWLYSHKTALIMSPRSQKIQADNEAKGPGSPDLHIEDDSFKFEPDLLHREYCPWRNPQTQAGVGLFSGLPGWESLVNTVLEQASARSHGHHLHAHHSRSGLGGAGPAGSVGSQQSSLLHPAASASSVSLAGSAADRSKRAGELLQDKDKDRLSRFQKLKGALGWKKGKPKSASGTAPGSATATPPPASPL